jgi:hypothetical protein
MYTCYTTKYDTVEDGLTECASEGNPGGGGKEANLQIRLPGCPVRVRVTQSYLGQIKVTLA